MKISRRTVIAMSAALPATAAVTTGAAWLRWWDRPHGEGLTFLADDEYAFAQALAEAWMPPGGDPALSGADANLGLWLDGMLAHLHPTQSAAIKALCQVLDDLPIPTHGAGFRSLSLETRQGILAGWTQARTSTFRGGVTSVVLLMGMGWTTHPDVAAYLAPSMGCGWHR